MYVYTRQGGQLIWLKIEQCLLMIAVYAVPGHNECLVEVLVDGD